MRSHGNEKRSMWNRTPSFVKGFVIGAGITTLVYICMCALVGHEGSGDNMGLRTVVALFYTPLVLPTAAMLAMFSVSLHIQTGYDIPFAVFCLNFLINGTLFGTFVWLLSIARRFDKTRR